MEIEKIDLYKYFGLQRQEGANGYLNIYKPLFSPEYCTKRVRPVMIVIPGGAYVMMSDREKEPVAVKYMAEGFLACSLEYSVEPIGYPTQLLEGCMAVAYVRQNAEALHADPEHIATIGFSAGGHLCGCLATMWDEEVVAKTLKCKGEDCRPDAVVLSYPVISSSPCGHQYSFQVLAKDDLELKAKLSLENRVKENSTPAFIWCTAGDVDVPPMNSLLMAKAYIEAKVPYELHIYERGTHGLSIATEEVAYHDGDTNIINPNVAMWFNKSVSWLRLRGFILRNDG